jgi:hypothetical protein
MRLRPAGCGMAMSAALAYWPLLTASGYAIAKWSEAASTPGVYLPSPGGLMDGPEADRRFGRRLPAGRHPR